MNHETEKGLECVRYTLDYATLKDKPIGYSPDGKKAVLPVCAGTPPLLNIRTVEDLRAQYDALSRAIGPANATQVIQFSINGKPIVTILPNGVSYIHQEDYQIQLLQQGSEAVKTYNDVIKQVHETTKGLRGALNLLAHNARTKH